MSVQVTQPEINLREKLVENKQRYGIKGKQILESDLVCEIRSLVGADRKNLIINGNFDIWQRGTTFPISTTGIYTTDRWFASRSSSVGNYTVSKVSADIGEYAVKLQRDPGDTFTEFMGLTYIIETIECIKLRGKNLSAKIRIKQGADFNSDNLKLAVSQTSDDDQTFSRATHGSIVSSSPDWKTINADINTTTEFKEYDISLGLILDTTNTISVRVGWNPLTATAGADDSITIDKIQVELGDQATEFEQRFISEEIELCERYYQKSYDLDVDPGTISPNGSIAEVSTRNSNVNTIGTQFLTTMRSAPTVVLYSPADGTPGSIQNSTTKTAFAENISSTGFTHVDSIAAGTNANWAIYQFTADAEL